MSAVAMDMQLDFWSVQEPELVQAPALAVIDRDGSVGGERTLEEFILGAWEELAAHHSTPCPICDADMEAVGGIGGPVRSATCRSCGTELS